MNEPAAPQSPDTRKHVGHETTDASAFYVGLFALGLALMIALVLLFLGLDVLAVRSLSRAGRSRCRARWPAIRLPPAPRLQSPAQCRFG